MESIGCIWVFVEPHIPQRKRDENKSYKRKAGAGRKTLDKRGIFLAIVYVLRTGMPWKALPKEFGVASSVHQYFQQWEQAGVFLALWKAGLAEYDEMESIAWEWQAIDGANLKAPIGKEEVGLTPPIGGKNGSKRHLLVEEHGVPLSIDVTGANRHDGAKLADVLDGKIVEPPQDWEGKQHHKTIINRSSAQ